MRTNDFVQQCQQTISQVLQWHVTQSSLQSHVLFWQELCWPPFSKRDRFYVTGMPDLSDKGTGNEHQSQILWQICRRTLAPLADLTSHMILCNTEIS
jgi:hypothetical protein